MDDPNEHKIRSFLGLRTYYRWFISSFPNVAKPLNKLKEKQAFQTVKEALCTAPFLLTLHQDRCPLLTDTSNVEFRGVMSQVQDGQK
jgi:hypothetical protein